MNRLASVLHQPGLRRTAAVARRRGPAVVAAVALLALAWQGTLAGTPVNLDPIHIQVRNVASAFRDSDAEHAAGAYYKGVGAFFVLDLLRGANTVPKQPPQRGVRAWAIYLMQTFGPRLDKIPKNEVIGISVDYYDYDAHLFRQFVVEAPVKTAGDPSTYQITLDSGAYTEPADTGATASGAPSAAPSATDAPAGDLIYTFDDPGTALAGWRPVGGTWAAAKGGYTQTATDGYDYMSFLNQALPGDLTISANVTFVSGQMGAGLLFNGTTAGLKAGAEMVSYTGQGTYLQWGYYDASGAFVFQGGATVPTGADGAVHQLSVSIHGLAFDVTLDGKPVGKNIPVVPVRGGYVGLLDSTSSVVFDNVTISGASAAAVASAANAAASSSAAPTTAPTASDAPGSSAAPGASGAPASGGTGGAYTQTFDSAAATSDFSPVAGTWAIQAGAYEETATGQYDTFALYNNRLTGDLRIEVTLKVVSGDMGGGLIFNAPTLGSKAGATMVSFTGRGTYLQWGTFDPSGVFKFVGGSGIPNVGDGKWHKIAIRIHGGLYNIALDNGAVATDLKLTATSDGYAGLFNSLSDTAFDTFTVKGGQ